MKKAIEQEEFNELNELLKIRHIFMKDVDEWKAANPGTILSQNDKEKLKEVLGLDQELERVLKEKMSENIQLRGQLKDRSRASKKYGNYQSLTNGAFVDTFK
ncbi:hypothetical protein [Bacillus sp. FJAT-18017]|uniref:hypothetical protein n=1 Tax=Bacillus sp. FJAT-18017 TaxID=1705566 RepID=UPI0018D02A1A|nr:hypothetical protein [Bacillus sp. FJAT-18017]